MAADARHGDGRAAEDLAARHLRGQGLAIVARNVRSRHGEIDLVAPDGKTIVFVEVRLRRTGRYGGAAASITASKRSRMVAAAHEYLATLPRTPPCRFDVVLLDGLDGARVEWLRDAIETNG
ncbi:MAG: YraN family protein [Betaproteobacteria bacterium]